MLHDMDVPAIVKAIDDRIATLQQVRDLLSATTVPATEKRVKAAVIAIQPKSAKRAAKSAAADKSGGRKSMSDEGRARIAAAQKKRWALQHAGTTAAKTSAKAKPVAAKTSAGKKAPAKKGTSAKPTVAKKIAVKKTPVPKPAPDADTTPASAEEATAS